MSIVAYTMEEFAASLERVGIGAGDTVIMHSSLVHLGLPSSTAPERTAMALIECIRDRLGTDGTLAVLAPNYDYGRKNTPFDTASSPVEKSLGVLSATVAALPDVERSPNPIFSIAAVGSRAQSMCRVPTATAFGTGSPWNLLHAWNARILMVGAPTRYMTFIRYIEHQYGVPYLYNKVFDTPVYTKGKRCDSTVVALLRYRDLTIHYDLNRFTERLRGEGVLRETALGNGQVTAVDAADAFRVGTNCLHENIYFFLAHRPDFVRGKMPFDVIGD